MDSSSGVAEAASVVRVQGWHIQHVASRLREVDAKECYARDRRDPKVIIAEGVKSSKPCQTILVHGEPAAIFGVTPMEYGCGAIWLLGTDRLLEVKRHLIRQSRPLVDGLMQFYLALGNVVLAENTLHRRWLEWAGFTINPEILTIGVHGEEFLSFSRCASPTPSLSA